MQLRYYVRILQQGWWISAVTTLIALLISLVVSYCTTPLYRATANLLVAPASKLTTGQDIIASLNGIEQRTVAATYAEIIDSNAIRAQVLRVLAIDPARLNGYTIETRVLPESNILALSVTGTDPQLAAAVANATGQQAIGYVGGIPHVYDLSFMDVAHVPSGRSAPKPSRTATIAMVLGLVAGCVITLLWKHPATPATQQPPSNHRTSVRQRQPLVNRKADAA